LLDFVGEPAEALAEEIEKVALGFVRRAVANDRGFRGVASQLLARTR
jgi:hypothetical protein